MLEIKKIDMCEECFDKKAEYSFFKQAENFFRVKVWSGLLCKDCIKELRTEEASKK